MAKKYQKDSSNFLIAISFAAIALVSVFYIANRVTNQAITESDAAFAVVTENATLRGDYIIFQPKNGKVATLGRGGYWTVTESLRNTGSYQHTPDNMTVLNDRQHLFVTATSSRGDYDIKLRFNRNESEWWLNGVWVSKRSGNNIDLVSYSPIFPKNSDLSEKDFWLNLYEQSIGDRVAIGEAFKGDMRIPLYEVNIANQTEGDILGSLIIKNGVMKAFK